MDKLTVELIPKTCWWSSVRAMVTPTQWDKIRKISYTNADNKCEICGENGIKQGYKHNVECHEIFDFDMDTKIQKLVSLISLCPKCHFTKHIGRAMVMGRQQLCFKQLARVNKWTPEQIRIHVEEAFLTYHERSLYEWTLDISLLNKDPYKLNLDLGKTRIFEVKKYKKKKKKIITKLKIKSKKPPKK